MLIKTLLAVTLAMGVVSCGIVFGQVSPSEDATPTRPDKSLVYQLDAFGRVVDAFGRSLFDRILPDGVNSGRHGAASRPPRRKVDPEREHVSSSSSRAGSVWGNLSNLTAESSQPTRKHATSPARRESKSPSNEASSEIPPKRPTLHKRLAALQRSAFIPDDEKEVSASAGASTASDILVAKEVQPAAPAPTGSKLLTPPRPITKEVHQIERIAPDLPTSEQRPTSAIRAKDTVNPAATAVVREATSTGASLHSTAPHPPQTANPIRTARRQPRAKAATPRDDNLLFARKSPALSIETTGPRRISVGKESRYEVTIENSGEIAADDVVVFVDLPEWADVLGAEASEGTTESPAASRDSRVLRWRVGDLQANVRQRLLLRIVPQVSRPFDLGVRWECKPGASQATIEVQEPKLEIKLEGPREVLYGQREVYKLHLANTGNGDAEDVIIRLMPIGQGGNRPTSQNLGTLAAGERRTIEMELIAREVGNVLIRVEVRGNGPTHAELAERVVVRCAALEIDVAGPGVQYVDAVATYRLRLRNTGTAAAKNVKLSVNMPRGAKYLSGIENARPEVVGNKLRFSLDRLDPAAERTFVIQCRLGLPGPNRLDVVSIADGDLTATAGTTTKVEAIADLVLNVKDPVGPVPVGEEATYELHIRNRGTKTAPNVEVVAYFSRGIEPIAAEGMQHQIAPGQVVFSPISSVAAGGTLVLTIHVRAETAGNHVFRTEVHSRSLGTRLVSEETTYFYERASAEVESPPVSSPGAPPRTTNVRSSEIVPRVAGESTMVAPLR